MHRRKIKANDLAKIRIPLDPRLSHDGKRVIFTTKSVKEDLTGYQFGIKLLDIETNSNRELTNGPDDSMPRWSPDGSCIWFLRKETGRQHIRQFPLSGGESVKIAELPFGSVNMFDISPDGKWLTFIFQADETRERDEKGEAKPYSHILTDRLYYRMDGTGYDSHETAKLYIMKSGGGKLVEVGSAPKSHVTFFSWDSTSEKIAYSANLENNPDMNSDAMSLVIYDIKSRQTVILDKPEGPVSFLKWMNQTPQLLFAGHFKPHGHWGVENMDIHLYNLESGTISTLTQSLNRCTDFHTLGDITPSSVIQMPVVTLDDQKVYFTVSSEGGNPLMCCDLKTNEILSVLEGPEAIVEYSASTDGKHWVFHLAQLERPDELWYFRNTEERILKRLTHLNDDYLETVDFIVPEVHTISGDGAMIQLFILKPPHFSPRKKYPLLLQIHGGPRAQYGYTWFHEMQVFAADGYVVIYGNPQGSQGFGASFADAISAQWGEPAMGDLMSAVDYTVALGCIDEEQLFVTGGSYGGYMTNWIVGHTDRFKAAIAQRSVTNLESFFYTSDIGWDIANEFEGTPWDQPDIYKKWSPISYAEKITTPLLLLHSDHDLRCSSEQAEQLFVRLKFLKRDVKLLRFPEESHGLSRGGTPFRRIKRLELMLNYFREYRSDSGADATF